MRPSDLLDEVLEHGDRDDDVQSFTRSVRRRADWDDQTEQKLQCEQQGARVRSQYALRHGVGTVTSGPCDVNATRPLFGVRPAA